MMMFAEFGKFQQAGFAIAFGLFVVLCAALTFTPALLLLSGRWAFWPDIRSETVTPEAEWRPRFSLLSHLQERRWLEQLWERIAGAVAARPATILLLCIALMTPFAAVAIVQHDHLSYGLLSDLPQEDASVVGAKAIQRHFAAGITGSTTVLLHNPRLDIPSGAAGSTPGELFAAALTESLSKRSAELNIVDIRSQKDPLGTVAPLKSFGDLLAKPLLRNQALKTYLSSEGELAGDVVRLDLVFNIDPFSRDSIEQLTQAEQAIRDALPHAYEALLVDRWEKEQYERTLDDADGFSDASMDANADLSAPPLDEIRNQAEKLAAETGVGSVGPTASIRDLKHVTDRDQIRIFVLVVAAVYLVLIALLRKPAICGFLIVSVVFSYLVTLGITFAVFWARDPAGFAGLDWKVPIFLFTILIAMGEDYNILLMARVEEEQRTRPPVDAVLTALIKTGSIISSCGVIMAGTFSSLMTGSLLGMVELGFALALGVLLDTFVIRPIVVPAYLVLLHRGRFGKLGPWLGGKAPSEVPPPRHIHSTRAPRESRSAL
jgi:RND superfamily putative drug exporter